MRIEVPGSTSNLGSGFDSIGLAVQKYLRLEVTQSDRWHFEQISANLSGMPADKRNLIYQTAAAVAKEAGGFLPASRVKVNSELPLARGLGSSAAAIVAGIELANQLLALSLTNEEKFAFATRFENHGDNVAASIFGGLVVTANVNENPRVLKANVPDVDLVFIVPSYELKTENARSILPEILPFKKAVMASGVANLLITAMIQNNWALAGELMSEDIFHQPYRAPLIPNLPLAERTAKEAGAFGLALSGAGPSLIAIAPSGKGREIATAFKSQFPGEEVLVTRPAAQGAGAQKKNPITKQAL